MANLNYDVGDTARLTALFVDEAAAPVDQTNMAAVVTKPDGVSTSYDNAAVQHDGTGAYHLDIDIDQAGRWYAKFMGDTDTVQVSLYVRVDATDANHLYVTRDELKSTLGIGTAEFPDEDIDLACEAASRTIDGYKHTRFYPTTETRYYTAGCYDRYIAIDDAVSITSVSVDTDGNGSYETTWVSGTDYLLDPVNAGLAGRPTYRVTLRPQAGRVFPGYIDAIKVVGVFGWAEAPAHVKQASKILAARLLKRARETPYGILAVVSDTATAARLGRIDPDVAFLLDQLPGSRTTLFV